MSSVTQNSDRDFLIQSFMKLTVKQIQDFLRKNKLKVSGKKEELKDRITSALESRDISESSLIAVLDTILPWSKCHAFLYVGARKPGQIWLNETSLNKVLTNHRLTHLFNATTPLLLPEKLTLSSIIRKDNSLRVMAIQKREYSVREQELDEVGETEEGEDIEYRAFVKQIARVMVVFDWELRTGEAILQITELPSGGKYEEVQDAFF